MFKNNPDGLGSQGGPNILLFLFGNTIGVLPLAPGEKISPIDGGTSGVPTWPLGLGIGILSDDLFVILCVELDVPLPPALLLSRSNNFLSALSKDSS
jgi:hypothetical protein